MDHGQFSGSLSDACSQPLQPASALSDFSFHRGSAIDFTSSPAALQLEFLFKPIVTLGAFINHKSFPVFCAFRIIFTYTGHKTRGTANQTAQQGPYNRNKRTDCSPCRRSSRSSQTGMVRFCFRFSVKTPYHFPIFRSFRIFEIHDSSAFRTISHYLVSFLCLILQFAGIKKTHPCFAHYRGHANARNTTQRQGHVHIQTHLDKRTVFHEIWRFPIIPSLEDNVIFKICLCCYFVIFAPFCLAIFNYYSTQK